MPKIILAILFMSTAAFADEATKPAPAPVATSAPVISGLLILRTSPADTTAGYADVAKCDAEAKRQSELKIIKATCVHLQ